MAASTMCLIVLGMSALAAVGSTHPTTTSSRTSSKCERMPASSAYRGTCYFQYIKGRGMVREQCPYGTRYNERACECLRVSSRGVSSPDDTSGEDTVSPISSLMQNKARIIQALLRHTQSGALERLLKRRGGDEDDDNERDDDRGRRGDNDNDNDGDDRGSRGGSRSGGGLGPAVKSGAKHFLSRILGMFTKGLFSGPSRYSYVPSRSSYNHRSQNPRVMSDLRYPSRGEDFGNDEDFHDNKDEADDDNSRWTTPTVGGTTRTGSGVTGSGSNANNGGKSYEDFSDDYGDIMRILFNRHGVSDGGNDKNNDGGIGGASTSDDGGISSGGNGVTSGGTGNDGDGKSRGDDMDDDIVAKIQRVLGAARGSGSIYGGQAVTTTTSRDNDVNDRGDDGGYSYDGGNDDGNDRKTTTTIPKHDYTSPFSVKGMLTRVKDFRFEDLLNDIFGDKAGRDGGDSSGGSSSESSISGGSSSYGGGYSYGGDSYSPDDNRNNDGSTYSTQGYTRGGTSGSDDGYSTTKASGNDNGGTVDFGTTNNYGSEGGSSGSSYTTKSYGGDGGHSGGQGLANYGTVGGGGQSMDNDVQGDGFDGDNGDDLDDNEIFDDYEGIYENKFDGVLEYVNKLTNDIFNDDFDDFYEDLFDDDGYDDCFDDKYDHIFDEDYDKEIDDKYDDIETFFSKRGDDNDGGNSYSNSNHNGGNRGDGIDGTGLDDKNDDQGVNRSTNNDNDDGIWSGQGKFDIYDNLFNNMKNAGTQDSRLFNFGETLKSAAGTLSRRSDSDDGFFDEFYKDT